MADPLEYINVAGKSNIWIGLPAYRTLTGEYTQMLKVGEQMNETSISIQHYLHDVPGDRYGGPQGPPIERQMLGMVARVNFQLSRWSQAVRRALEKHNVFSNHGVVGESEVGSLLLRDRSFRVLIEPAKSNTIPVGVEDEGGDYFCFNFPCAMLTSPVEVGQGTKFSMLTFSMEAHRAPDGHPNEGILFDRNDELPT